MLDLLLSRYYNIIFIILIYFISLTIHEYSHGFVAYKLGDPTAKDSGRLSLNPIRHIDPIGLIMMVLVRFGWAKPVPVNPLYFRNPKKGMMLTAIAGPVSNLLLSFVSAFITYVLVYINHAVGSDVVYYASVFFSLMTHVNTALAVFNLIPIHPLDGSRILNYFLPNSFSNFFYKYGNYIYIAFFVILMTTDVVSNAISVVQSYVFTAYGYLLKTPAYLLANLFV